MNILRWFKTIRKFFSRVPQVPRKEGFSCTETAPGVFSLRFLGPTFIETPFCWKEIQQLSQRHGKLLLLGLFDWSNYSYQVVFDICDHQELFAKENIGLAAFCPGSLAQIAKILPEYDTSLNPPTSDPFMFLIENGSLKKVRFGPLNALEILKWVLL